MKTYDQIIGDLMTNLIELEEFVKEHEPDELDYIQSIITDIKNFDEFMAYSSYTDTPLQDSVLGGVDFSESLSKLKSLGKSSVNGLTLIK